MQARNGIRDENHCLMAIMVKAKLNQEAALDQHCTARNTFVVTMSLSEPELRRGC